MGTPRDPAVRSAKRALRREVLARRAAMSPQQRAEASRLIRDAMLTLPEFRQAQGVHLFVNFPEEVDTASLIEACRAAGKAVYLPYQLPDAGRLGCARWELGVALVAGPFGTLEPPSQVRTPVDLAGIGLVLVPGVAFDRRGGRLGYGRGYYDAFLAELRAAGHRPALLAEAFSCQMVPSVPRESWDVAIPLLLTEQELIRS